MNIFVLIFTFIYFLSFLDFSKTNKFEITQKYRFTISSLIFLILSIIIGFRDIIGADYGGYLLDFHQAEHNYIFLNKILVTDDPIYSLLNFIVIYFGFSFEHLNLIIGSIVIFALLFFSLKEKDYLLIILIFLSYYFIVYGMGYVRQGLSLAFLFFFIHNWRNQKIIYSYLFFLLAIASHKFSFIMGFLLFISPKGNFMLYNKYLLIIILFFCLMLLVKIFPLADVKYYIETYSKEKSYGAIYRSLVFACTAVIFFLKISYFKDRLDFRYLYISALLILAISFSSFFFSTIADRLIGYFLPFIMIVLSNIQYSFRNFSSSFVRHTFVFGLFIHLYLWTNFTFQSQYYNPYNMVDYPGSVTIDNRDHITKNILRNILNYDGFILIKKYEKFPETH